MAAYNQNMHELITILNNDINDETMSRRRTPVYPRRAMYDFTYIFPDNPQSRQYRIGLNADEIAATTTTMVYDPSMSTHHQCPIGLEPFSPGDEIVRINGCGHTFLSVNLARWFNGSTACPVCRYNLLDTFDSYATPGDT
jgi:hypothetical protein